MNDIWRRNLEAKVTLANIMLTNWFRADGHLDTRDISKVYTESMREQGVFVDLSPIWDDGYSDSGMLEFLKIRDVA